MVVRNAHKTFVAFSSVAGNSVCINPANVTRVEEANGCIWIYTTDGGHVGVHGDDVDAVVELLEEGLV